MTTEGLAIINSLLVDLKAAHERDKARLQRWSDLLARGITPPEWAINPLRRNIDYQAPARKTFL